MSYQPRVAYSSVKTVREMIRWLAGSDPVELRDLALNLLDDLESARAELKKVDDALHTAGIDHPLGARGVRDLASQRDGELAARRELRDELGALRQAAKEEQR